MEDTPAITEAAPSSAAPTGADTNSQPGVGTISIDQIDTSKLSLEDLDGLLGNPTQSREIPLKSGGEGITAPAPAVPVVPAAPVSTGIPPVEIVPPATTQVPVEPTTQEVLEQTPEEIDAAAAQVAADAAAAAAAQPAAPAVNERDQLIAGVRQHAISNGRTMTWAEAEAVIDGPKAEPVAPAPPPPNYSQIVVDLETELADVTTQLDNAGDQLSNAELRNLQRKQSSLDTQILQAKDKLATATARATELATLARQQIQTQRDQAFDSALELYPDAGDDTTALGKAVAARIAAMENPNHPEHKILEAISAPLTVAKLVAAEMGIAPKQKAGSKPATPPVNTPVVPPRKVMSPVPGNLTAVQPAKPAEDAKAQLDVVLHGNSVPLDVLDQIQGGDPTKALAALASRH